MNYIKIDECSVCNGIGIRTVLWVSGCSCKCKGCQNKETWDFDYGKPYTSETEAIIISSLKHDYVTGLTLSGGHPLERVNLSDCTQLAKRIKEEYPKKDIWIYTGFEWEDVKSLPIMNYIDVLVDGKYVDELRDITLAWRGSSNQRVIDVQKSLAKGKVVLYCE